MAKKVGKLFIHGYVELNKRLFQAIFKIEPSVRLGNAGGYYWSDFNNIEVLIPRESFTIIEEAPVDDRPRLPLLNIPLGKLPESHILAQVVSGSRIRTAKPSLFIG